MRKALAILLFVALLFGAAAAESWTVFVVGFDFITGEVVLEDEDGFQWVCTFGESEWVLGEEYILVLTEGEEEIWEVE